MPPQTYTNTLRLGKTPVTEGASYRISANPDGHTPEEISVDPATGGVTRMNYLDPASLAFTPQISSNEVWRSSDGGLTWDQVAGGTPLHRARRSRIGGAGKRRGRQTLRDRRSHDGRSGKRRTG